MDALAGGAPATPRAPARTMGGYRLGPLIGSGHTARVFLGRKAGPGGFAKIAAVKIFDASLAGDGGTTAAFLAEARLTARVNHPQVRRLLDCGHTPDRCFLVLDYVRGRPWSEVLAALSGDEALRPRVPVLAAHVFSQVCEGVHALHQAAASDDEPRGIVHADLTPHNLMVGYDGSVHVLDLGAACAEGQHASPCQRTELSAYRAPEQVADGAIDRRADLWSLGVMLREAFGGDHDPGAVAPELREIMDRASARDSEARSFDARELGSALRSYLTRADERGLDDELARVMQRLFATELEREHEIVRTLAGEPRTALPRAERRNGPRGRKLVWVLAACAALATGLGIGSLITRPSSRETSRARTLTAPSRLDMQERRGVGVTERAADVRTTEEAPNLHHMETRPGFGPIEQQPSTPIERRRSRAPASTAFRSRAPAPASTAFRSRAPAAASTGVLVVGIQQGWAEVSAGGVGLGTTPLQTELPAGTQTLEVRPYGTGAVRRVRITVRPGRVTKLRLAP